MFRARQRAVERADGNVQQGSTGPVPARGQRTPRPQMEPNRNGAAHAYRVVPRSLPRVPVGPLHGASAAVVNMTFQIEH